MDLLGPDLLKTPFEVIWQEDKSWGDSWASRHFETLEEANEFFESRVKGDFSSAWLGEIGTYKEKGISKEGYFYFAAYKPAPEYEGVLDEMKRGRGILWYNDEESSDENGNIALINYDAIPAHSDA